MKAIVFWAQFAGKYIFQILMHFDEILIWLKIELVTYEYDKCKQNV